MKRLTLFLIPYLLWLVCQGQSQQQNVINIRQRLLQRKPDEMKEQVDSFSTLHLMIAGNVYQTEKHIKYAYDPLTGRYDFKNELKYVEPLLNLGDITIVNLKTAFADNPDNNFSSPDEFALALKYSGINALMHANLYTANIDKSTLTRTRDMLNKYDMYHTGAFADKYERAGNYPLVITKKGFKIAVLNYTYMPSRPDISRDFYINEIDKSAIDRDMRMAFAYKPDFIIAYFNWGDDEQEIPSHAQQELAQYVFEKGANLVIGSCPNQPMRLDYLDYYKDGKQREGVVAYSLGNLVASDDEIKNRKGYLIDMEIKKNNFTTETKIDDWGVIPVYTYFDTTTVAGKTSIYSLPCWAVESGDIFPDIPYIEKRRVVNGAYEVRKMVGSSADEIQYNVNERIVNNVVEAIHITNASLNNKFSQVREAELKVSPPPSATAALLTSSQVSPSLAMVKQQSNPPMNYTKANQSTYLREKSKAEEIFSSPPSVDSNVAAENNSVTNRGSTPFAGNMAAGASQNNVQNSALVASPAVTPAVSSTTSASSNVPHVADNNAVSGSGIPDANNAAASGLSNNISPAGTSAVNPASNSAAVPVNGAASSKPNNQIPPVQSAAQKSGNSSPDNSQGGNSFSLNNETYAKGKTGTNIPTGTDASPNNYKVGSDTYRNSNSTYEAENSSVPRKSTFELPSPEKMRAAVANLPVIDESNALTTTVAEVQPALSANKGKDLAIQADTFYCIQIFALQKLMPMDTNYYTHLKGYEVVEDKGFFKYLLGHYTTYQECYAYWKSQMQPRYKQSFIVKYIERKRILK